MSLTKPGIYILIIKSPNKTYKYVGQSINISKRVYTHKNALKKEKHYNTYLQNVFNKYCNNVKDIQIKYINYEKQYLNIMEQTWINMIQFELCVCLNTRPGKACRGYTLDEKHKAKISKSLKESKKAQASIQKCLKVRMENYTGKTEAQLKVSREAAKKLHTPEAKAKRLKSIKTSIKWKEGRIKAAEKLKGRKLGPSKIKGSKNGRSDNTLYVFQNKKSEEIFVGTRYELAEKLSKTSYTLSNLITGKEKSAFGYKLLASPLPK